MGAEWRGGGGRGGGGGGGGGGRESFVRRLVLLQAMRYDIGELPSLNSDCSNDAAAYERCQTKTSEWRLLQRQAICSSIHYLDTSPVNRGEFFCGCQWDQRNKWMIVLHTCGMSIRPLVSCEALGWCIVKYGMFEQTSCQLWSIRMMSYRKVCCKLVQTSCVAAVKH